MPSFNDLLHRTTFVCFSNLQRTSAPHFTPICFNDFLPVSTSFCTAHHPSTRPFQRRISQVCPSVSTTFSYAARRSVLCRFVTSVCAVPHVDPLLVSGSGDGTVRLWEAAGQQLDIVDLRTATAPNAMVRQVCVTAHYVAVIATRIQGVVLVPFDRKGGRKFAAPVTVALNATPARIFVDPTGHLWVLVLNDTMPLRVLTVGEACDAQEASDETICACVQKFAGLVGPLTAQALCAINLSEITKTAADRGAESYFARKEERLKGKEAAGQKRGEDKPHVSAGPTKRARPDNKAQGKKQ
eukprot:m.158299 g.158299  ORF g.158299 m.158299 type:complete len:298 (+) comp17597_c0_seq7:48-941(+)